ncbi:MAG: DNA gyrase inhibitor YacG [Deltaproteobacteria bacterium]|nr:DNA gyrase inhibitor YacG [Deltaproteobacteria bacterium]
MHTCPTCGARFERATSHAHGPFCSARCQLLDLSRWLNEEHRVPSAEPVPLSDNSPADEDSLT